MTYEWGTCEKILKWKPISLNSVDFVALWHSGVLYLATRFIHPKGATQQTEDIPLSVLDAQDDDGYLETLDRAIVEAAFDEASAAWRPLRIRTDKQTPNPYTVFKSVYDSIKDNVSFEDLVDRFRYLDS
jgi:hypothetical protein